MLLTLNQLSLPTHILQALQGDIIATNSVQPKQVTRAHEALTHAPVSIALTSNCIRAIDSPYYELEVHTITGDNTHVNYLD